MTLGHDNFECLYINVEQKSIELHKDHTAGRKNSHPSPFGNNWKGVSGTSLRQFHLSKPGHAAVSVISHAQRTPKP